MSIRHSPSNLSHSGLEGNLEFSVLLAEPEKYSYALHRFNALTLQGIKLDLRELQIQTT